MGERKSLEERVAILEIKEAGLSQEIVTLKKILEESVKTNSSIKELTTKIDEMYPIVKDVITVKSYGNFFWRTTRYVGSAVVILFMYGSQIKEHLKHVWHYLFD